MTTRIYPEHLVSAYILQKFRQDKQRVDPKEAASVIPKLLKINIIELMRTSYRSSALGKYSPEIRGYFAFLREMGYTLFQDNPVITRLGVEHAQSVINKLHEKNQFAAKKLELAFR